MMNLYDVLFFTEKFPYILKLQIEESENEYESEVKRYFHSFNIMDS